MIDRDDKLMTEAYESIEEGFFDRRKADSAGKDAFKASGGKTGFGGLAQRAKHGVIKGLGGQIDPKEQKALARQGLARDTARVTAIVNQHVNKLKADLGKMELPADWTDDEELFNIVQSILNYTPKQG